MKTKLDIRRNHFIYWAVPIFILLFGITIWLSWNDISSSSISSIQPEVNSIKDCVDSIDSHNNQCIVLLDLIEKKIEVKHKKALMDSAQLFKIINSVRKELTNSSNRSIDDLVLKIEEKSNQFEKKSINNFKSDWVSNIFSWPIIIFFVIIALIYFNFNLRDVQSVLGNVKSVNIFGSGVEFGEQVKINTELSIKQYRSNIKEIFGYQIQKEQLDDRLRYAVGDIKQSLATTHGKEQSKIHLRCTIHIQDILFYETLYQLLDYYPATKNGGSGRIKSIRFGIIGLAWRTEKSKIRGNIDSNKDQLIKDWGLDISEASSDSRLKSFAAILLKSEEGTRLGVMYFDSEIENLFGDSTKDRELKTQAENFEKIVIEKCKKREICKSLINLQNNLADKFLQLRIYE